ncbi:MAG: S8 family serine peptidase [Longimonas sp.]|uniref:S8 family serine peptidase n=1 Tax=Longimonas sp. TaxID=2039626 RepID=UPI0039762C82
MAKGFPDFRRADTLRVLENERTYRVPDYTNLFVITLPPNANRDSVVARLNRLPEWVQYAEKNQQPDPRLSSESRSQTVSLDAGRATDEVIPPDQDDFDKQWGLRNTSGPDIGATEAWSYTTGSSNTTIGIVDSGVEATHVDLSDKVSGFTNPSVDHGTSVAGVAAAKGDNPAGKVAGVDWHAKIHSEPLGGLVGTAQSIDNAVTAGASVINNSWGFADQSTTLTQALRSAYEADVLLVHANPYKSGPPAQTSSYPNNVGPWIVNVGAMDQSGAASSYTASRSFTDVGAPGDDIRTTVLGSDHDDKTGTSFAAPFVTGTASLLLAAEPSLRAYDIEHILKRTAQSYGSGHDPEVGYGMIDAHEAVKRVSDPYEVSHGPASFTKIREDALRSFPNGFVKENGISYGAGNYICDVYELSASASSPEFYYEDTPWFWLPVTEQGFSAANPNDGSRYLSKSVSESSAEATTYFYYVKSNVNGQEIGWVPFDPTVHKRNGSFEYTVIGEPGGTPPPPPLEVTLSGPGTVNSGQSGTWTADVEGGEGSTSYSWGVREPGSINWTQKFCSGPSCSHTFSNFDDQIQDGAVRVSVTRGSETVQADQTVFVSPDCADNVFLCPATQIAEVSSFEAAPQGESAQLAWTTTGSMGEGTFRVQHRADSTATWSDLQTVEVAERTPVDSTDAPTYQIETDALAPGTHQFRLQWAAGGETALLSDVVEAEITLEDPYRLRAYPNPAGAQMTVESAVKERQHVRVQIYDVLGRRVTTVYDGPMAPNEVKRFTVQPGADGLSSGTYFLRMTGEQFQTTTRISVVR